MKTLFKPTSYPTGAALAVSATFVWKAISFANALLLALYFGADRKTDVYFYVIMLSGLGVTFLQRLNQTVLIPEAMFLREQKEQNARRFINMWLFIYAAGTVCVSVAAVVAAEPLGRLFSRFSGAVLAQDKSLLIGGFMLLALQIITYYLTAVAEMYKFFKTAWLGVLNALLPLVFLLVFGEKTGIISMIYGFLVANVLQIAILLYLLKTQLQWNFAPAFVPLRVQTRQNMLTGQTLAVLDMLNSWLPIYLISGMNAGLVSTLNYAKQFTDSATEVFTSRVANIAKIEMTQEAAQNNPGAFHETFVRLNHVLLIILGPLAVFSCYFAPQIVDLFFQRGHFGPQAAQDTVRFLRPLLFTVLLLVPAYLQSNTLAAWRKIKENFPYSAATSVAFTIALVGLLPRWGAFSFPYIYLGALSSGWLVSYVFFRRYFAQVPFLTTVWDFFRLLALNLAALCPALWIYRYTNGASSFVTLLVCGSVFIAGYFLLLYLTKDVQRLMQEIKTGRNA